jgi:putative DNA primase/helicase
MTIGEIAKREGKVLQWTEEIVEPTYVVEPDFFESNFIKKFQDEYNIKNARGIGLSKFNGIKWSQDDAIYQWSYDFDAYVKQQSVKSAKPDNFIQKWSKLSKVNSVEKFLDKNTIMPNITHDGINTDKGYIPFDTGKIRPAVPEDCFIQHARKGDSQSVVGEVSPWEKFIMEIFPDKEEANYLQRVLGSCLSLSTRDQLIWLFIGQGGNGKSVLMNVIEYVLNDYAVRLPIGFFEKRSCVDTSRGMASLIGKRLAYTTEIPNYINEDLLKEIAGGDTVVGRYLYHESFNFDTSAKIIMLGNIIPRLIDYSDGLKRRLMIIPFKQNFIKKPNLNIAQELKEDTNSVFNWLWVGYLNWLALGVRQGIPKSFMLASLEAHHINDSVEQFIEDCLEKSEDMYILVKDLYPLYLDWVQPEKGMGRNNFWRALHAKGITQEVKNIDGKTFKVVKNFTFKNMFKNA